MENETYEHEKNYSEIGEKYIYGLDQLTLDGKWWHKCAFERKLKIIYDINIFNSMTCIYNNKVNHIDKFNLLHDILNPSKHTKYINSHYSPILHGCVNTRKGKSKFNNFRILLYIVCSFTIFIRSMITTLKHK